MWPTWLNSKQKKNMNISQQNTAEKGSESKPKFTELSILGRTVPLKGQIRSCASIGHKRRWELMLDHASEHSYDNYKYLCKPRDKKQQPRSSVLPATVLEIRGLLWIIKWKIKMLLVLWDSVKPSKKLTCCSRFNFYLFGSTAPSTMAPSMPTSWFWI